MRKTILLLLCLCILLSLTVPVSGASRWIIDEAGLLTEDEITTLDALAAQLREEYEMDVVIVTVNTLGSKTSEQFADDYFDNNGYGYGADGSGVLLLLSMEYRDWAISTCGETIYALTDYGVQELFGKIADALAVDAYNEAFTLYLMELDGYLDAYEGGSSIDGSPGNYQGPGSFQPGTAEDIIYYPQKQADSFTAEDVLIPLVIGIVVAAIVLLIMRSQMNTARHQHGATSYMADDSYQLRQQRDMFLYSRTHRVRRSEDSNNGSRGGGSSVHRSSSGRSHGGGHGKF